MLLDLHTGSQAAGEMVWDTGSQAAGEMVWDTGSQAAGEMVWDYLLFKNFPQFVVIHTVKGFSVVNEAEVDVFLEFSCFFYDTTDVGNLISGSSAISIFSLNIWFTYC